jgi:thiamine biosynthesis lipoprotein
MGAPAWEFSATGTRWRLYHSGALNASVAATAQEAVRADEARWSRFRDDSETTRLNRRAGTWVAVSEETFALLAACREWTERSGGVFQPLVGRVLAAAGYDASIDRRAPGAAVTPVARPVRAELGLRRADRTVRVPPGTALDLGGIGKGWIALPAGSPSCAATPRC